MKRAEWTGNIAPVQGSVKSGGADGGGRILLDIPDADYNRIVGVLNAMRGKALRITIEEDDAPVYGQRTDDD